MLNIFNDLEPFFVDNYRRINVREYSRIRKISAPTASKVLCEFMKDGLLTSENDRNYIYYKANRENTIFLQISRVYWIKKIQESGMIEYMEREISNPLVILFGSLSKAEARKDSDIDIAIFSLSGKKINLEQFEKKLGRHIHFFVFKNERDVGQNLLPNLRNGIILTGSW